MFKDAHAVIGEYVGYSLILWDTDSGEYKAVDASGAPVVFYTIDSLVRVWIKLGLNIHNTLFLHDKNEWMVVMSWNDQKKRFDHKNDLKWCVSSDMATALRVATRQAIESLNKI